MTLQSQRQDLEESIQDSNGGVYTVPYRVIQDDGSYLAPLDAREKAILDGTSDIGIAPSSAPIRRASMSEVVVDLSFNLNEYRELIVFKEANPTGTYTPKIIDESSGRVFPPQPVELETAYAVNQVSNTLLSSTSLQQTINAVNVHGLSTKLPIYPPQENFSRRFSVPASLLTGAYFFAVAKAAHKLNSDTITLGGTIFSPETVMLLSASVDVTGPGFGLVQMGFAVGEEYIEDWVSTDGATTSNETMTGIKPFSQLTRYREIVEATITDPPSEKVYALTEHRVFRTAAYTAILP